MEYLYGLLKYSTNNIGDEIQSLAAKQFLPQVDVLLDRDYLKEVKSDKKIKLIMNGWFTHCPNNWPPSSAIKPLFISFHITPAIAGKMTSPESLKYFKMHEPIGCRDLYTRDLLKSKGIDAYFSGCLTLTLHKTIFKQSKDVLVVDLDRKNLKYLSNQLVKNAVFINHYAFFPSTGAIATFLSNILRKYYFFTDKLKSDSFLKKSFMRIESFFLKKIKNERRFKKAEELLNMYANAQLVITSRLHCALPCLAFGTPVIFVYKNLESLRFKEYLKYFHAYSSEDFQKKIQDFYLNKPYKNPDSLKHIQEELVKSCEGFIQRD